MVSNPPQHDIITGTAVPGRADGTGTSLLEFFDFLGVREFQSILFLASLCRFRVQVQKSRDFRPNGPNRGASPETAVISMINPSAEEARADTRGASCGYVNYFASASAYDSWAKDHPGATFLTLKDAHAKGRERNPNR